jgi:hypothetical protein
VTAAATTDGSARGAAAVRVGRGLGASGTAVVVAALVCFVSRAYPPAQGSGARLLTLAGLLVGCALAFAAALRIARRRGLHAGGALPLAAGALACAYFTAYAAHAVPALRVIGSPVVAAGLLAAAAALGTVAARRFRARSLAGLAAALALVAVLVPPVPAAALVAAAVLVVAAFTRVVPDAWRPVPQAMLVLTYAGFALHHLFVGGFPTVPYPSRPEFFAGALLLASYAAAFAWPVWRSDAPAFTERERAAFLCLDLALACPLTAAVLPRGTPWALAAMLAAAGALLLALAALIHRRHAAFPLLFRASLTPGLVALAAAGAAYAFPPVAPLAPLMALSGMALAMAAEYVESLPLRGLTLLVSLTAAALACTTADAAAAFTAAAVLLYTAFFVDRHRESSNPGSAFFALAGSAVVVAAVLAHVGPARQPLALAVLGVLVVGLGQFACVRPLAAAGQVPIVAAYVLFLRRPGPFDGSAVTVAAIVAAGALANAWWRSLVAGRTLRAARGAMTALHAIATAAAVCVGLRAWMAPDAAVRWLVLPALLALAAALYAAFTRDRATGTAWQALLLLAVAQFALRGGEARRLAAAGHPTPAALAVALLAPIAALLLLAAIADGRLLRRPATGEWPRVASAVARGLAAALAIAWCAWFVAPTLQFVLLEALAVAWLVRAAHRNDTTGVALSTLVSTGAVWLFWLAAPGIDGFRALDLVGFVLLLVQQQLWRHRYPRLVPAALHTPAMILGIGSLWRWAHVTTAALWGTEWITLGWAGVGAVACGLGLLRREPAYRVLGLAILAAALARVVGLGPAVSTGTRVVTAAVIGILATALGLAYERLSERGRLEVHG